jgi:hypothetical protein
MSVPAAELSLSDARVMLSYDSPYRLAAFVGHIYHKKYSCGQANKSCEVIETVSVVLHVRTNACS